MVLRFLLGLYLLMLGGLFLLGASVVVLRLGVGAGLLAAGVAVVVSAWPVDAPEG